MIAFPYAGATMKQYECSSVDEFSGVKCTFADIAIEAITRQPSTRDVSVYRGVKAKAMKMLVAKKTRETCAK